MNFVCVPRGKKYLEPPVFSSDIIHVIRSLMNEKVELWKWAYLQITLTHSMRRSALQFEYRSLKSPVLLLLLLL